MKHSVLAEACQAARDRIKEDQMNSKLLRGFSSGMAALMLASVAIAEPADAENTEDKNSSSGTEQKTSNGDENSATPATPSKNASDQAFQTPSRTAKKSKKSKRKRFGRIRAPKVNLFRKKHRTAAKNRSADRIGGATGSATNQSKAKATASDENAANGSGSTADQTGGNGSTGSAVQGNLPTQKANQTENNQNNSQKNINTNITGAQVFAGLVNVNVSNVNLNIYKVIDIHNVLNNSQIEALTQKIQNSPGAQAKMDLLNNLLQGSHILNKNKVAVGVLSSMKRVLTMDKAEAEKKGLPTD